MENHSARDAVPWADATLIQRVAALLYLVAQMGFLVLLPFGFLAAVHGWRPGAYILLVSFMVYFLARDFAVAVFASSEGAIADLTLHELVYLIAGVLFFLLLIVGISAGLFGWRFGAYLALVGLTGHLVGHVAVGARAYRRVMSRPWPRVLPLADDDDW